MRTSRFYFLCLLLNCSLLTRATTHNAPDTTLSFTQNIQIKQLFFEALYAKNQDNYPLAIEIHKKILNIAPQQHASMYELAFLLTKQNKLDEALHYIEQACDLNPNNEWYLMLAADLYQNNKDTQHLLNTLDKLIKINPHKTAFYHNKATVLTENNQLEEALAVYQIIEEKFESTDEILLGKQKIYIKQNKLEKAVEDLQEKIKESPNSIRYYLLLAEIYDANDKEDEALAILEKAKKIDPQYPQLYVKTADIYRLQKKNDWALQELEIAFASPNLDIDEKTQILLTYIVQSNSSTTFTQIKNLVKIILQTHPNEAKAHSMYANILLEEGKIDEAIAAYKTSLKIDNQNYTAWENLIRANISKGYYQQAISDGEQALALFPNQIILNYFVALAYAQTKDTKNTLSYLKTAVSLSSDNKELMSQIYATLGDTYHETQQFTASDNAYEQSIKYNPNNVYALNNFAYFLSLRNERLKDAEAMSIKANELNPNNTSFQDTYAWILFKLRNYEEAKKWIEKVINQENTNHNAVELEHYGDILYHLNLKEQAIIQWQKAKEIGGNSTILNKKIDEKKYIE